MVIDVELISKFASPALTLALTLFGWYRQPRSKLVVYYGHISTFTLASQPPMNVFAHNMVIQNRGSKSASNVRVLHQATTENFRVDPPLTYTMVNHPQGGFQLTFETLTPKSQVVISYLYFPPLTAGQIGGSVMSDDEVAQVVNPYVQATSLQKLTALIFMFVGAAVIFYWPIRAVVQWLATNVLS